MGRDKAFIPIEGIPMVARVAAALREAGAVEVLAVGGDVDALAALGLRTVIDEAPHEGPLGGILTALDAAAEDVVVITACDMPWITAVHVEALVGALGDAEVAVSADEGQWQPLHAVWSRRAAGALRRVFDTGERSPRRAVQALDHRVIELGVGAWARDLDSPQDLER